MHSTSCSEMLPRAQRALCNSPIQSLRELRVEETAAGLVITGLVSSFYHKQLAQEVVRAVAEGTAIVNSVRVR